MSTRPSGLRRLPMLVGAPRRSLKIRQPKLSQQPSQRLPLHPQLGEQRVSDLLSHRPRHHHRLIGQRRLKPRNRIRDPARLPQHSQLVRPQLVDPSHRSPQRPTGRAQPARWPLCRHAPRLTIRTHTSGAAAQKNGPLSHAG
jgi:hypothetical protein